MSLRARSSRYLAAAIVAVMTNAVTAVPETKPVDGGQFATLIAKAIQACPQCGRNGVLIVSSKANETQATELAKIVGTRLVNKYVKLKTLPEMPRSYMSMVQGSVDPGMAIVAYELAPDAVRVIAEVAKAKKVLTISTIEEDLGMVSLALNRKPSESYLFKSSTRLRLEGVQFSTFDELPAHTGLPQGEKNAEHRHAQGIKLMSTGSNAANVVQGARNLQRAIYHLPNEMYLSRTREHYLPHYQLGRAFFFLKNCEAALLELRLSESQKYIKGTKEDQDLNRLLASARQQCGE